MTSVKRQDKFLIIKVVNPDLQIKLQNLPAKPGVYLFRNLEGKIIYIGKAKNLQHRVHSYFRQGRVPDPKTEAMIQEIDDVEFLVTDSELEAFMLESNLVKDNGPKYNVRLKDDKRFLMIKLTVNEAYPRVMLTRRVANDSALYFGPYLPASLARNTIKLINRSFQLRTCDIEIDGKRDRPCLEYHIKRCLGPCVTGLCVPGQYRSAVNDVVLLLQGKNEQLAAKLEQKMMAAAEEARFEAAAFYRDRLNIIRDLARSQRMINNRLDNVDVFGYHREGSRLALQLFTMREGKLLGKKEFFWEGLLSFEPAQFLREATQQFYIVGTFIPTTIYVPEEIEDQELMETWLSERSGQRVHIYVPRRGKKRQLVEFATRNAKIAFDARFRISRSTKIQVLHQLEEALDLPHPPSRIEAFDISNIQGSETVASMVVCVDGVMNKGQYRKFKVRSVSSPDDFASLREVVYRRYRKLLTGEHSLPDLILIDGGKGQLHAAAEALDKLNLDIPLASIAKREETIFVRGWDDPVELEKTSPVLHLIQEIRDEAHRFAVTYHRKRRSIRDAQSELDSVIGIGEVRKKTLLRYFGSLKRIRDASETELAKVVGPKAARAVKEGLG
ncbi:MAG: excinuclease ABC subunit UvrC [Acidobacteria bacterium]|nr:excinuclease ABC subunit UvrC [Acidobacteriota bacterium]